MIDGSRDRRIDLPSLGRRPDAEMDHEIDAHLQLAIDDLVADGTPPEAARRLAELRFGDLRTARHQLHIAARRREVALRRRDWLGAVAADMRFAARQIRRSAAHSALTIGTLALGIGVTTAIFTLVERVLLRPLPFAHAEQLVSLQGEDSLRRPVFSVSTDDALDWRDQSRSLAGIALHSFPSRYGVTTGDSATRLNLVSASGDFFPVLGTHFLAGRPFNVAEAQSRDRVAVVSEQTWRNYLGGDPALLKPLVIGSNTYQVVGVVATGAEYPAGTDVWVPMMLVRGAGGALRNNINYQAIGRLKVGSTIDQTTRDLLRVSRNIRAHDQGGLYDFGVAVAPLSTVIVGADIARSLRLLMRSVLMVLLLVCANLTIATLSRGAARQQEMAVRASLGATRGRLMIQLLVEHLLLALTGGAAGIAVAWVTVRAMIATWGDWIPRASEVHLDLSVVGFAAAVAITVGVLVGLLPAFRGSRASLQQAMQHGGRIASGGTRVARSLVVAEFALALTLLAGAGILIHSFQRLLGHSLGFDRRVATVEVVLSGPKYAADSRQRLETWDQLIGAFRAIPGVTRVGVANWIPLGTAGSSFVDIAGSDQPNEGAGYRVVSEDYLTALGVHLMRGRRFGADDGASGAPVVLINQAMAERYWPKGNPIGQQIRAKSMEAGPHGAQDAPWRTVIGVVSNLRQWGPASDPLPEMYASFRQAPGWSTTSMTAVIRSALPPAQLFPMIRTKLREVDPHLAADVSTMDIQLSNQLAPRRLTMLLLTGFAGLAVLLAALGVYAVLSYTVVLQAREIAIRSALGAQRSDLLATVVRNGATTAGAGIVLGIGAAATLSRLLQAMVVDVTTLDPLAFGGAVLVLGIAGAGAILIPAVRATRVDPLRIMKGE